ncbi:MAG: M14 family murein peptide amidase A [Gammaproteobacteria bacterium]
MRLIIKFNLILLLTVAAFTANAEMTAGEVCQKIAGKLASVSLRECNSQNFVLSGGKSINNLPILIKTYPPLATRKPLGKVLMIGGIHGDEYSSVSVVFKWMNTLNQYHSGMFHWRIAPLMNPDGLLQESSQRMNANGVDLNRNFPSPDWEDEALKHWVERTGENERRYPGTGPASEPETQWLVNEIKEFQPDVIVAIHAPYGVVDYDGPHDAPHKLGRLHLELLGTYPGSLGRYAGIELETPLVTIELPYAGIMPTPAEINDIWLDLVRWLRENMTQQAAGIRQIQQIKQANEYDDTH